MQYFTIEELCKSETAQKLKIDNTPSDQIVYNLTLLVECLLDPLREAWGSPILVNSGYRCPVLNKAVGGAKTSAHLCGFAVDIIPKNGKMREFQKFVIDFLKDKFWDQCILEQSGNTEWIHLSLFSSTTKQRRQIFSLDV